MALIYTKKLFIERVRKHLANGFPNDDFNISNNEILLYIDESIPFVMKGQMFENAKVTGVLDVPEAYLVTYQFTISNQDSNTGEWNVTLPQPPLALPTGYDIPNVYLANGTDGRSQNAWPIKAKRTAYREYMPVPGGFSYRLEGYKMYLKSNEGHGLLGEKLSVQMPISRTDDINTVMSMPDDAMEAVFLKVVGKILQRYQIPQDVVNDGLPAGNKTS